MFLTHPVSGHCKRQTLLSQCSVVGWGRYVTYSAGLRNIVLLGDIQSLDYYTDFGSRLASHEIIIVKYYFL